MSRYQHSKSGLFLMELLINLMLFCVLCGFGLMFFIKANNLSKDTTALHQAVSITSSIASIYEAGDSSFSSLCEEYEYAEKKDLGLYIYFDEEYQPCASKNAVSYALAIQTDSFPCRIVIEFYDQNEDMIYSITSCNYTPSTLGDIKGVQVP